MTFSLFSLCDLRPEPMIHSWSRCYLEFCLDKVIGGPRGDGSPEPEEDDLIREHNDKLHRMIEAKKEEDEEREILKIPKN